MFTIDDIIISAYEGVVNFVEDMNRVKDGLEYVNENAPKWTVDTLDKLTKKAGL